MLYGVGVRSRFDASVVDISVLIAPFGYAKFPLKSQSLLCDPTYCKFTNQLIIESITPNSGSLGGRRVVIAGAGFSATATRHFVRVGEMSGTGLCEPVTSSYSSLSCIMNYGSNKV